MRLDEAVKQVDEVELEARPPRDFRLLVTLVVAGLWPFFVLLLLKLMPPGGAVFTFEDPPSGVASSAVAPAVPAPPGGEGRHAGPAPFWVDPPPAIRMKLILPAEPPGNPIARKGISRRGKSREAKP